MTKRDKFLVTLTSANTCLFARKIIVVGPNGRVVISNKNKSAIEFMANCTGKYVVKIWIYHSCEGHDFDRLMDVLKNKKPISTSLYDGLEKRTHLEDQMAVFKVNIFSYSLAFDTVDHDTTKIRTYNLLGSHKEGALHKGEKIKEKCMEQPKRY